MKKTLSIIAVAGLLFSVAACKHSPQLDNAPVISYKDDVQPIISGNCMQGGCHGGGEDGGAFSLATYDDMRGHVKAGDARSSSIYRAIRGNGGNIMPPSSQSRLTDNEIITIYLWIEEGAQNN